jgi:hypothetical protein
MALLGQCRFANAAASWHWCSLASSANAFSRTAATFRRCFSASAMCAQHSYLYCKWASVASHCCHSAIVWARRIFEAAAVKPKEEGCCGCHPLCLGGTCIDKALAMSSLLIKKSLMMGSLLAFIGCMLIQELLVMISLLAFVSSAFVKEALVGRCLVAGAFFHPPGVPGTTLEYVLFLCAPLTCRMRWPPHCQQWYLGLRDRRV